MVALRIQGPDSKASARRALDDLFSVARRYNSSAAYFELMQFIGRFRFYSPFNAMLIHTQMAGARFVATPSRWRDDFSREVKAGARPIVILQPMGPVLFVIDVAETEAMPGAPSLPPEVECPFEVRQGRITSELATTIENAKRDGIRVSERAHGSQRAGSIQYAPTIETLDVVIGTAVQRVPLRYELLLNTNLSAESQYATLAHELGHLYCGHLGSPNSKWWPDRQGLPIEIREFEAESACYLVCTRLGIENPSAQYLSGYVKKYESTPPISLDAVLKSALLIEKMGQGRLGLRKNSSIGGRG